MSDHLFYIGIVFDGYRKNFADCQLVFRRTLFFWLLNLTCKLYLFSAPVATLTSDWGSLSILTHPDKQFPNIYGYCEVVKEESKTADKVACSFSREIR